MLVCGCLCVWTLDIRMSPPCPGAVRRVQRRMYALSALVLPMRFVVPTKYVMAIFKM